MSKEYIYESPDKGETVYRREIGKTDRELYKTRHDHYMEKLVEHDTKRMSWSDREAYWKSYGFQVVYD